MDKHELIRAINDYIIDVTRKSDRDHEEFMQFMCMDPSECTDEDLIDRMNRNSYYRGQLRMALDIIAILKKATN